MTDEPVTNEPLTSLPVRQEVSLVDRLKAEIGAEHSPDYVQDRYPVFSGMACVEEQILEGDKIYSVVRYGEFRKDVIGDWDGKSEPTGKRAVVPLALEWMPFSFAPLRLEARVDTIGEERVPVYVVEVKSFHCDAHTRSLFKYTLKM